MFKNKTVSGRNNIAGRNIAQLRKSATPKMSQRLLADKVQLEGLDLDKNAIQRIESGQRFVTDIELKVFLMSVIILKQNPLNCRSGGFTFLYYFFCKAFNFSSSSLILLSLDSNSFF